MPLLLLLACAPLPPPEGLPDAPDYARLHGEATRELRIVEHFETRLLLRATLVDEDLARAQALALALAHHDSPAAYDARLIESTADARASWVLVLAADDPTGREELDLDGRADWTLRLRADGEPAEGHGLTRLDPDDDPDLALLYPQANRWSSLWMARFERASDARTLELAVAGPRGQGLLSWNP